MKKTLRYLMMLCLISAPQVVRGAEDQEDATDHDPPVIQHTPVAQAVLNVSIEISARIVDANPVAFPRVYYRHVGETRYQMITMAPKGSTLLGVIPGFVVTSDGVEYYIEAFDTLGNGPTYHGTAEAPHRVTVVSNKTGTTPISTPFYKTWWFWTVAGVVVAGSVTTAVLLTRTDDPSRYREVSAPLPQPTLSDLK
jgi:hypothetical protein